jgi:hypothetical protein
VSDTAYRDGDFFLVPVRDSEMHALGLVARSSDRTGIALGYFFGPPRSDPPSQEELDGLEADRALAVRLFKHNSLVSGEWPVVGRSGDFTRDDWPVPDFGWRNGVTGEALRVELDEETLMEPIRETPIDPGEVDGLPPVGLFGPGAVERLLAHVLSSGS